MFVPVFFPWSLLAIFFPPATYLQDEGEKLHKLEQHFELLGRDCAEKLTRTLVMSLSG